MRIDLNADVGEGHDDLPIFAFVTSVNIACGAHAGDEDTMERSVAEAARIGIVVGAHPGYPDREGNGRRVLAVPPDELQASLVEQIRVLAGIAGRRGVRLAHVKPHGALYNQGADDPTLAALIAGAVHAADPSLRLVGLAGSELLSAASRARLDATAEAFADRRYLSNGRLAARAMPRAVVDDPTEAANQALAIARGDPFATVDGGSISLRAETLCIHADTPGAVRVARAVRGALERAEVKIAAVGER